MPINKFWYIIPVAVVLLVIWFWSSEKDDGLIEEVDEIESSELNQSDSDQRNETSNVIMVDVKGEVERPGVYEMREGQRVIDVIEQAGGLTSSADQTSVNLAMLLADEMVIYVATINDQQPQQVETMNESNKIRINVADIDELTQIPGIGEQKAKAIIQYREEHGYFNSAEDLLNISGIGKKTLERIQEFIMVP
ncbi:helix-hairpin-helix domain-containing protein [Piscibacillus halophilus]|uniref:Competence protein ComEA n=1 Tax=Piscibacillus halophilus TaxID=571933 RepID=A0A1H9BPS0_9BACI|nr:helix-hairpin-helix domain-containing protein [Piscibacillus halophilus]SEP90994.1 competence protein ComEA [Piscibacillus halophilus]